METHVATETTKRNHCMRIRTGKLILSILSASGNPFASQPSKIGVGNLTEA